MSEEGFDDNGDDGSGLGSSPICPLVASFNATFYTHQCYYM
ncbi:MAG TPA: hypothetical protein VIW25_14110 [Nitrososphaeraceae archaeon]